MISNHLATSVKKCLVSLHFLDLLIPTFKTVYNDGFHIALKMFTLSLLFKNEFSALYGIVLNKT